MYRGNFDIEDYVVERTPLAHADGVSGPETSSPSLCAARPTVLRVTLSVSRQPRTASSLSFAPTRRSIGSGSASSPKRTSMSGAAANRCRISTCAAAASRSGPRSRASGATRPPKSRFKADVAGKAGGDYWNTNYPQPTYLSSRALRAACGDNGLFGFRFSDRPAFMKSKSGRCRTASS